MGRCRPGLRLADLRLVWRLVYFTPILGGLLADRLLGTKATVVLGALLMSAGHIAMAFDASFLIALGLLILGSGCLKGNISAQVGQLYPDAAEALRTQAYAIYSAGINIGAVAGPAGLRRARRRLWLACRLRLRGRADDRRPHHLSRRPAPLPGGRKRRSGSTIRR